MKKRAAELERSAQIMGRHPRSYPRQNLVWEKDKQMTWRLSRLQNAKNDLVSVLEAEGSADILQQHHQQGKQAQGSSSSSSARDRDNSESMHSRTDSTQTTSSSSSVSETLRPGSAAVKREKKAEHLRNTKKRLKGAIGAIGVVKYLEQSDEISIVSDQDKVERQKALLHVRMFGVKTSSGATLERRKRDAIMKNALNRQFKRSDFNPMPGPCSPRVQSYQEAGCAVLFLRFCVFAFFFCVLFVLFCFSIARSRRRCLLSHTARRR